MAQTSKQEELLNLSPRAKLFHKLPPQERRIESRKLILTRFSHNTQYPTANPSLLRGSVAPRRTPVFSSIIIPSASPR